MTTTTVVTLPVIKALLDEADRKRFAGGVLGVCAKPDWDGPTEFDHNGVPVRVVACPSALAVREALLDRAPDRWLVVLTDREDTELGVGITAHLVWHRLRRPDPWAAVQDRFGATRIDHRLVTGGQTRELAIGLLTATPPDGWAPARAALLTRDHALGAVAAARLELGKPGEPLDLPAVLRWSARADAATALADLRALAGDRLVEALLDWIAERCGTPGEGIGRLLRNGRAGDVVPAGLVARVVLAAAPGSGPRALLGREVGGQLADHVWSAWAAEAEMVTRDLVVGDHDAAAYVLGRAEVLLDRLEAGSLAAESAVLRRGLSYRLAALGDALRRGADRASARMAGDGSDGPLVDAIVLPAIEDARRGVEEHALSRHSDEVRVPRALAGVRLARWLAQPAAAAHDVGALVARHRDDDAWADRAIADAWTGVEDEALSQGLRAMLGAARLRRDAHDAAFGQLFAQHAERRAAAPAGLVYLEDLLAGTVMPLAKRHPVLLIVADGMSQAVATEVVDDVVRRYDSWLECLPTERDRRVAAIAPLPSLTKVCRASLFSGELTVGEQHAERNGLEVLAKSHGLTTRLFHKVSLDTSVEGYALAHDVAAAIDDLSGTALVACVLNTIDDALDRSDPGGTAWTADTVKHLRPLLERARRAGRIVVLTSDHGHVVERRQGRLHSVIGASSNRSRPAAGGPALADGEVRVRGSRVLLHDGDAVLAVDERLRYGPLKAGYHGGASPAEVVVPVSVLVPGEAPDGWRLAPPQSPSWWRGPLAESVRLKDGKAPSRAVVPTLFDVTLPESVTADGPTTVAQAVLASSVYREQRARATRAAVTDEQIRGLLGALLAGPAHRLDPESAAAALGVATIQLTGALSQAQRLLNVEQYPVLSRDADGATVVLDVDLMREQFGVQL
ncbi:BREX-2 system phosphatase PglZ [Micromonospora sp. NBC_00389]|uniref:BREX-2 system phosphatase PglZ n=1 Tax=Micromonospora sp. NBC_00389 TaxID=2903586 RepID=UPI002E249D81